MWEEVWQYGYPVEVTAARNENGNGGGGGSENLTTTSLSSSSTSMSSLSSSSTLMTVPATSILNPNPNGHGNGNGTGNGNGFNGGSLTTSQNPKSGLLPLNAQIGIGVGLGVIVLGLCLFFLVHFLRRRQVRKSFLLSSDDEDGFVVKKSELDGQPIATEGEVVEVAGREFDVVEIGGMEVRGELGIGIEVEVVEMEGERRAGG